MAAPPRPLTPAARWLAELRAHPTRHDLLAAADLLARVADEATGDAPRPAPPDLSPGTSSRPRLPDLSPGTSSPAPSPTAVRFACSPDLALALGELAGVAPDPEDPSTEVVTTRGPGLLGPDSPLPLAVADELAAAPLAAAVFDLFHHRRVAVTVDGLRAADLARGLDGADPWSRRLAALLGLDALADPADPLALLRLAPVFAAPDRSPRALGLALRRLLAGTPGLARLTLRLEPIADARTDLDPADATRLAAPTATLGDRAALGTALRLPSAAARLVLAPVPAAALPALRPGGHLHARLRALLAAFHPDLPALELRLELEDMSEQTCPSGPPALGRDCWLTAGHTPRRVTVPL
jgi:predicted component of type VI protein secretion system